MRRFVARLRSLLARKAREPFRIDPRLEELAAELDRHSEQLAELERQTNPLYRHE